MSEEGQTLLQKIGMTRAQADDIVQHVVIQRLRWQKQYDGKDVGFHKLCDALVVIAHGENHAETELRKSLTLANRQLGAAQAREVRLRKKIAELTGKPYQDAPELDEAVE